MKQETLFATGFSLWKKNFTAAAYPLLSQFSSVPSLMFLKPPLCQCFPLIHINSRFLSLWKSLLCFNWLPPPKPSQLHFVKYWVQEQLHSYPSGMKRKKLLSQKSNPPLLPRNVPYVIPDFQSKGKEVFCWCVGKAQPGYKTWKLYIK